MGIDKSLASIIPHSFLKHFSPMKAKSTGFDLKAVFVSLSAALIFWLMNALNKDGYSQKISFPLQVRYDDSLYIPLQPLPENVLVNVSGNGWTLLRKALSLHTSPIIYPITKPLKTKFLNTESLTDSLNEMIRDVRVNYVVADHFDIEFDRKVSKTFAIKVDSSSIPLKDRYVVSSLININPKTITLVGPESVLEELGAFIEVKVPGKRLQENYDDEIKIVYPRNAHITSSKDKVEVSFEVAELLK
jgi:YbbR domain-containing protein